MKQIDSSNEVPDTKALLTNIPTYCAITLIGGIIIPCSRLLELDGVMFSTLAQLITGLNYMKRYGCHFFMCTGFIGTFSKFGSTQVKGP